MKKKMLAVLTGLMIMTAVCSATVSTDNIAIADVTPGSSIETAKQKLGTPNQHGDKFFFPNGIVIETADHNPNLVEEIDAGLLHPVDVAAMVDDLHLVGLVILRHAGVRRHLQGRCVLEHELLFVSHVVLPALEKPRLQSGAVVFQKSSSRRRLSGRRPQATFGSVRPRRRDTFPR